MADVAGDGEERKVVGGVVQQQEADGVEGEEELARGVPARELVEELQRVPDAVLRGAGG